MILAGLFWLVAGMSLFAAVLYLGVCKVGKVWERSDEDG